MASEFFRPPFSDDVLRRCVGREMCAVLHNDMIFYGHVSEIRDGHLIMTAAKAHTAGSKAKVKHADGQLKSRVVKGKKTKAATKGKAAANKAEVNAFGYPGFGYPGYGSLARIAIPLFLLAFLVSGPFFGPFGFW